MIRLSVLPGCRGGRRGLRGERLGLGLAAGVLGGGLLAAGCRPLPPPPPTSDPGRGADAETDADVVSSIADSIRAALRDSVDAFVRDSLAATRRRDSIAAAARRDSIEQAARDSIAAAATRDSMAAAARRDSILQAAQDSIAAAARRDSIAAAARRDSIEATAREAAREAAREDSIALAEAAARRDSIAREAARRDSIAAVIEGALRDSIAAARQPADVEELRALGPAYIPYDRGPSATWDTDTQAMLTTTLLPVVRAENLTARARAYFWLLIDAEGRVVEAVLQTSSGNDAFDGAAARVATQLRFVPAERGGRAVPTWVVRDVSLIMQ